MDNDITLADTQVSRLHLELVYREGQWLLCSHGRNGTRIDGAPVTEVRLADRTVFAVHIGASTALAVASHGEQQRVYELGPILLVPAFALVFCQSGLLGFGTAMLLASLLIVRWSGYRMVPYRTAVQAPSDADPGREEVT